MGNIKDALVVLFGYEDIYDNDPDDPGGETIYGIARRMWPEEYLWPKLDAIKKGEKDKNKIKVLIQNNISILIDDVYAFYKRNFWDVFGCDHLPQPVAVEIFEQAVNIGVYTCTKHIQKALNVLNRNQELWKDIDVDGKMGRITKELLIKACARETGYILGLLNIMQGNHYITVGNEKYIRGWITRAQWKYSAYVA